jgi:hypothetical protein
MTMIVAAVASALLLAAAADPPAGAAPDKAPPASKTVDPAVVQGKAKDDPNQLVCHSETPIGSRLPVKKCMTKGEAEMRKFEDRQALEKSQGDTYRR